MNLYFSTISIFTFLFFELFNNSPPPVILHLPMMLQSLFSGKGEYELAAMVHFLT